MSSQLVLGIFSGQADRLNKCCQPMIMQKSQSGSAWPVFESSVLSPPTLAILACGWLGAPASPYHFTRKNLTPNFNFDFFIFIHFVRMMPFGSKKSSRPIIVTKLYSSYGPFRNSFEDFAPLKY